MKALVVLLALAQSEEFDSAVEKAAKLSTCAFKLSLKVEGPSGGNWPLECKVDKDVIEIGGGKLLAYKKGDAIVWREGKTWKRLNTFRTDTMQLLRLVKAPHQILTGIGSKLKGVKAEDKKDKDFAVYAGELTDEGAKDYALQPGDTSGAVKLSGRARFWVGADLAKFEIVAEARARVKLKDVVLRTTRAYELRAQDGVTVDVPDAAKELLEEEE